jgi:hypothetical protein
MRVFLFLLVFLPLTLLGQSSGKVWTEVGLKGSLLKDLDYGVEVTNRFGATGLETFFPQVSFRYKVTKWFRPSLDYRLIFNQDDYGNYGYSNRLNANAEFRHTFFKRLTLAGRVRYQYSFDRFIAAANYEAEFDQAIRFKPQVSYDINNVFLTPTVSIEYFLNPSYGPLGQRFTKYRFYAGVDLDIDSPHGIYIGYILDQEINLPYPERKHILSIAYSYDLGWESKKDKKKGGKKDRSAGL